MSKSFDTLNQRHKYSQPTFEMHIIDGSFAPLYLRHRPIDADKSKREAGVWQLDATGEVPMVYVTCPEQGCKSVNNISEHAIDDDGFGSPCFVCAKCDRHHFFYLEDWAFVLHAAGVTWAKKVEHKDWSYEDAVRDFQRDHPGDSDTRMFWRI